MSHTDRKRSGIDQMQPVLVDTEGQIWLATSPFFWIRPRQPEGNIVDYAVSHLGFIHIWPVDGWSVVVALRPDRVHPKTMAAAFYAIADLQPVRVFIASTNPTRQGWELFKRVDRALNRIEQLVRGAVLRDRNPIVADMGNPQVERKRASERCPRSLAFPRSYEAARRRRGALRAADARRQTALRRGKGAMLASALAASFLTRLVAVSSLSFA